MNSLKQEPPQDCNLEGAKAQNYSLRAVITGDNNKALGFRQVDINSRGTMLHARPLKIKRKVPSYVRKEGDIETMSYKSRERFRSVLYLSRFPPDFESFDVTFTIPGELLAPKEAKDLFASFCKNMDRKKVCMIWRCEVQVKRGMLHYHACVGVHKSESVYRVFLEGWHDAVRSLGEVRNYKSYDKEGNLKFEVVSAPSRMSLPGAIERACLIKPATIKSTFWRYLCEHMSKSKQDQVGHDIGRHWGVVNRKHLESVPSVDRKSYLMTDAQWNRFSRFLCRLITPWIWDDKRQCYRRGFKPRINRNGTAIRFGHSESADRLAVFVGGQLVGGKL